MCETDVGFSSPRLDDGSSYFPLEYGLEELLNLPSLSLPLVTLSFYVNEDYICCEPYGVFTNVLYFDETLLSLGVMVEVLPNHDLVDHVSLSLLSIFYPFSSYSPPSSSPNCRNMSRSTIMVLLRKCD